MRAKPKIGKALPLFAAAGLINSIGLILNFEALKLGDVTVVYPLINKLAATVHNAVRLLILVAD